MKNIKKRVLSFLMVGAVMLGINVPAHAEWKQDNYGWWFNKGDSYSIGWDKIDNNWYYFKYNGYMKTSWIYFDGLWYYLSDSGALDNSKTTQNAPIKYTYDECEQIAKSYFSNSHQSGYKFKIVSDKKLGYSGTYIFTIYSENSNQKLDFFAVNAVTGEITV